ncbi:type II secretion system F family protein, partial [uncultured Phascolarctobacterium sp.]|uniref:type II secretion system F family protein n=1 Tax=uncultured Phascolarctobacterium sp. TaxID=512296 RepID=UPI0025E1F5FD
DTVSDRSYRSQLLLLNGRLQRGLDLSTALTGAEGLFSPLTQALLDVGAATGYLPRMLREAARIGEEDLRVKLAKIKEVLAPMLLLAAALVIAAVVCAVVSPLLEMLSALPA